MDFCVDDGAALSQTSDGRFVVSLGAGRPADETVTRFVPIAAKQVPQDQNSAWLYAVIGGLVAVILMGGGFLLFTAMPGEDEKAATNKTATASEPISHKGDTTSNRPANDQQTANANSKAVNAINAAAGANSMAAAGNLSVPVSDTTQKKSVSKSQHNGRVIMINALIRSGPSIYAPEIAIAAFDEPLKVRKKVAGNNPWYRVTTSTGTTGWMHGNTIEFVR